MAENLAAISMVLLGVLVVGTPVLLVRTVAKQIGDAEVRTTWVLVILGGLILAHLIVSATSVIAFLVILIGPDPHSPHQTVTFEQVTRLLGPLFLSLMSSCFLYCVQTFAFRLTKT